MNDVDKATEVLIEDGNSMNEERPDCFLYY